VLIGYSSQIDVANPPCLATGRTRWIWVQGWIVRYLGGCHLHPPWTVTDMSVRLISLLSAGAIFSPPAFDTPISTENSPRGALSGTQPPSSPPLCRRTRAAYPRGGVQHPEPSRMHGVLGTVDESVAARQLQTQRAARGEPDTSVVETHLSSLGVWLAKPNTDPTACFAVSAATRVAAHNTLVPSGRQKQGFLILTAWGWIALCFHTGRVP
jgi:hypothetical protein